MDTAWPPRHTKENALRSFLGKMLLGNLLLIAAIVSGGAFVSYRYLTEHHTAESYAAQDQLAHVLQTHFQQFWPRNPADLDAQCKALMKASSMRLTVVAADGQVLGDSQGEPAKMDNHRTAHRPEILDALDGQGGRDVRRSDTLGAEFRYVALPVVVGGRTVAAVRIAMRISQLTDSDAFIRNTLLAAAAGMVALVALLALLLNRIWYAPLKQISSAARQIADGDLASQLRIWGADEIAQLAQAVDQMRQGLLRQIRLIESARASLQTVVTGLADGVIALDAQQRVLMINPAATAMLGLRGSAAAVPDATTGGAAANVADGKPPTATPGHEAAPRPIQEVVRSIDIQAMVEHVARDGQTLARQIELPAEAGRRVLEAQVSKVGGPAGQDIDCLVVLRDVTDLVRAMAAKVELVANASHELRTPLATIRAAVDSIPADLNDPEGLRKIVGVLDRHVARLENMTRDLLDLHVVESGKIRIAPEDVLLGELAQWARAHYASRAQERGVSLDVAAAPTGRAFRTDRKLIELILANLLDNAIKFTATGGSVRCALDGAGEGQSKNESAAVILRVADTGCGIRMQDQPRVFERFFQAETSRSGDARSRGTGLGLAIVKHAAERLGAKIQLESEVGKGTTVTVTLPPLAG